MEKSDTITALATALALAQSKFEPVKRTETVDFSSASGRRRYNYAPLEEVIAACRKSLTENGLSILQLTSKTVENKFLLETVLLHKSGEWIKSEMDVAAHPTDPQKQGSVLTYTRRYALSALLGVASEEDDDAHAATKPSTAGAEGKPAATAAQPASGAEMMTQAQNSKLWVLAKEKGMSAVHVHALLTKTFPQHTSVTALTKVEAIKLIDLLEKMAAPTSVTDDSDLWPDEERDHLQPEPPAAAEKKPRDAATVRTFGDLYNYCHKDFGLDTRREVWKELGVDSQEALTDKPEELYRRIAAARQK